MSNCVRIKINMYGLTIYYPWCYLWLMDIKINETRPRGIRCQLPTQIIIHCASKKADSSAQKLADKYLGNDFKPSYGCAIGVCTLTSTTKINAEFINQQSPQEIELGNWQLGRVAWQAINKTLFNIPFHTTGYQAAPWRANEQLIELVKQELSFINQGDNNNLKLIKAKYNYNFYIIEWKGVPIGNYTPGIDDINTVREFCSRCQHIESINLKPSLRNCNIYWHEYEKLQPSIIESAFPWVVDDYFNNERRWRQIDKKHYGWYSDSIHNATAANAFLCNEVLAYSCESKPQSVYLACYEDNGSYYAQLMTLNEFQAK